MWNKCVALQPQHQCTFQNSPWQNFQEKLNQLPYKAAFGRRLLISCVWKSIILHGRERCNTCQNKVSLFLPHKFQKYAQIHQRIHLNKTISSALKRLCLNNRNRCIWNFLCIEAEGSQDFSRKILNVFYAVYVLADCNFFWKRGWSSDFSGSIDDIQFCCRGEVKLWPLK